MFKILFLFSLLYVFSVFSTSANPKIIEVTRFKGASTIHFYSKSDLNDSDIVYSGKADAAFSRCKGDYPEPVSLLDRRGNAVLLACAQGPVWVRKLYISMQGNEINIDCEIIARDTQTGKDASARVAARRGLGDLCAKTSNSK